MSHAVGVRHFEVLDWVLSKGAPVNFCDDEGYSPLKMALETEDRLVVYEGLGAKGVNRVIDRLIAAGADISFRHTLDETVLHRAAMISRPDVVRHLLARGADPCALDAEYTPRRPVDYAYLSKWSAEITAILREAMAEKDC